METSEKILHKAYELFKRYGIRSITMDEIATQCGVSKKTVYQFFEDKDSLVDSIMTSIIKKTETDCVFQQKVAENAVQEIFLSMEMVQDMLDGVNPALMYDLRKYHSSAYGKLEEHKHQFMYSFIKRNMERGMSEGLYRTDLNVDILTPFQLHTMMLPIEEDIFPTSKYTFIDINTEISLFLLHGMVNSKGETLIEQYMADRKKLQTS